MQRNHGGFLIWLFENIPISQSLLSGENQKLEKKYEIPFAVFFSVEKVSPLFVCGKLGSTGVIGSI
jgi:hypothetical protein